MSTGGHILVVDDEPDTRRTVELMVRAMGHEVTSAGDGDEALSLFDHGSFDLVLTDRMMPRLDGMELLAAIRGRDPDIPVILFTAAPTRDSAVQALNFRATGYLEKPLTSQGLRVEIDKALGLGRMARVRKEANTHSDRPAPRRPDEEKLAARFDNALRELFMVYQPIVSWSERSVFGFEALARTREQSIPHPGVLFDAAERLQRLPDIGRAIRSVVARPVVDHGSAALLFVNLHPHDLVDVELYAETSALAVIAPQVVLEMTERANLDSVPDLEGRIERLRDLGYRIAVDDIGAGYSGLNSFASLRPDLVKLDLSLVRDVDTAPLKQRLVRMLCDVSRDLGIEVVAEGVETAAERDALVGLGCNLLQGFLFARPGLPFPEPAFAD